MARIRTIKPEFWDSPGTAGASFKARLFFIALWNWADDYGKGTASAKQLIGFAFPNDVDVTVADYPSLASELHSAYEVVFYEVDGRPYFFIPKFSKHQRTEKKAASRIPDPPEGVSAGQGHIDGSSDVSGGSSDANEGASVPGTGEQGNRGTGEKDSPVAKAPDLFDEFWAAYPRKTDKGNARKAWTKALKKTRPEVLIAAAAALAATRPDPKFTAHPTTWLNGERWEDQPLTLITGGAGNGEPRPAADDVRNRWK